MLDKIEIRQYLPRPVQSASGVWTGLFTPGLNWVICGGETGPGTRPMNPDWAHSLRDQCAGAGVPFFFKKHGGANKSRILDGQEHNGMPGGGK